MPVIWGDQVVGLEVPVWSQLECWAQSRAWEQDLIAHASQYDLEVMCSSRSLKQREPEAALQQTRLGASDLSFQGMRSALSKAEEEEQEVV